jgi:hypothetical protein
MSDASTTKMISMYLEKATVPLFLSGFFKSPPENFHTSEEVEIDIQRDSETVAIVIQDLSLGPNFNNSTLYTNKRFKPPIYDEAGSINAFDMIQRQPGQNPFQSPDYGANAVRQAFEIFRKAENKIRRSVELMASQVLATGQLTLLNAAGVAVYALNFQPKATHFITTGTTWATDGATGDPLSDLAALADVVRQDGKSNPDVLIMGTSAFQRFIANTKVQAALNLRRGEFIEMAPQARGSGSTFQGWVWIGHYRFEVWTYNGFYAHPQTGTLTPFVNTDHVLMLSSNGRLDLTFGAIPMVVAPDSRVMGYLPPRIASEGRGLDLTTNAWVSPDGKTVNVSAGTRPLTIPTAIDTFARIDVTT